MCAAIIIANLSYYTIWKYPRRRRRSSWLVRKYSMSKVEKLRRRADFGKRRGYQERYHRHQRKILRSLIVTLSTEFHNTTLN